MRPQHGHPARRPSIGITPDRGQTHHEHPVPLYELKAAYADAVLKAGGLPFVLPYSEEPACLEAYLDRVSGLLISGGGFDIPPAAYGEPPKEGLGPTNPPRTAFESALVHAALARNLPVLGICGGMQLLNVVLGGTLHQDIPRELPSARGHMQSHDRSQPHHPIDAKDGTFLGELLGRGQLMVNSTHHQAVKKPGEKVVVSAMSSDGVIEGIEAPSYAFAVGVQWHPEMLLHSVPVHLGLYKALVNKARETRR
ncbi:MAG: gamma-glutamyl-gamma-aminobutyrate hydrolase family protein [Myxococcaceae bacterium]